MRRWSCLREGTDGKPGADSARLITSRLATTWHHATTVIRLDVLDEAESLCDRIAIVDGGKIIALDTPVGLKSMVPGADRIDLVVEKNPDAIAEMLRPMPYLREVNLDGGNRLQLSSNDGARAIPQILDAVEKAGDRVTAITVQKLSLEDVFIHFTGRTLRDEPAKKVSMFVGAGMPQQR